MGADLLTAFQVHVATTFFALEESEGYVVAGGAALLAHDLIARPTQDIDLFASTPVTSVAAAKASLLRALEHRECAVELVHDSPTFCRLVARHEDEEVLVDLAIDSPPRVPPTVTLLGPTLTPLELGGRKLLALFGRAEARDFADVHVLALRFGKEVLLEQAASIDAGFDRLVLAQMMGTIGRFVDDEIPVAGGAGPALRSFFDTWSRDISRSPL